MIRPSASVGLASMWCLARPASSRRASWRLATPVLPARRFIVATGSAPVIPPIPGLDSVPYFTNETLFDSAPKPSHLLVLGGGPIGVEMAQAYRRLGAEVTLVERKTDARARRSGALGHRARAVDRGRCDGPRGDSSFGGRKSWRRCRAHLRGRGYEPTTLRLSSAGSGGAAAKDRRSRAGGRRRCAERRRATH